MRWEQSPQEMWSAFSNQEGIMRRAIESNGGYAYKMIGDAFQAAFPTAPQAVNAALDAQRALHSEEWAVEGELRVRMALHTGVAEERGDDYVGPILNRVSRLLSAGHGGQVLLSFASAELARDNLPDGVSLRDMGEHRLRDLFRPERVFQLVAPGLPSEFPPLKTLGTRPNNLPLQPTPLVGREREVDEVADALCRDEVRLLTLTGPGGIGKTRLALQVAADLLDEFPDGVFFVPLAAITDPALVISAIAQTLAVREQGGQSLSDVLGEYLRGKRLLLVLDNFEQVVDAAKSVADLLIAAPHLKVLATSRASLRLSAEKQYAVPPLSLPPTEPGQLPPVERLTQYEAVTLFISRARAVKPSFEVNNQNAPAVAQICARLDGLPLAIELAAVRTKLLSPQEILERLESRLGRTSASGQEPGSRREPGQGSRREPGSRLKLLTGGARDLPTRQQTLRNTIEWSYDLLTDEEKELFRRLAVFVGGSTLDAIETVCSAHGSLQLEMLDGVASLVDKSLIQQQENDAGEYRYAMLETIREYARERLQESGELEEMSELHALYFLDFVEKVEPELRGPQRAEWLDRLEVEHDNLRAALHFTLMQSPTREHTADAHSAYVEAGVPGASRGVEVGLRMGAALWQFWWARGYLSEGRRWLGQAIEQERTSGESGRASAAGRAGALNGAGVLALQQGDFAAARPLLEESLALRKEFGDKSGVAASLNNLATVANGLGDYAEARRMFEEALAIRREMGDKRGIASGLANLGFLAMEQGDVSSARSLYEEALDLSRQLQDKLAMAYALNSLGLLTKNDGDYGRARSHFEEGLSIFRELGDKWGVATALGNFGLMAVEGEEFVKGRSLLQEALLLFQELGNIPGIAESLEGIADAAGGLGQLYRAARLWAAVDAIRHAIGAERWPADVARYEQSVSQLRSQLGDDAWQKEWAIGDAMSVEQAIEYALQER